MLMPLGLGQGGRISPPKVCTWADVFWPYFDPKFLGPKDCTVRHFWEIIIQHKVEVIVMLCNLQECSNSGMMKDKCARYWPADADQVKSIRKYPTLKLNLHPKVEFSEF